MVSLTGLPLLLAERHHDSAVGDIVTVAARLDASPDPRLVTDVVTGAGFSLAEPLPHDTGALRLTLRRERTLADTVGPDMRVLLVGLNPSLAAADAGYGFAGRSNRFWKAATGSGLVTVDRDPHAALADDRVGMTDLVKRATARAAEVDDDEFRTGLGRLGRLAEWLAPAVVCVVGITGWRAASGTRDATLGRQPRGLGPSTVYVMPNPSGLNAHTNHDDLVAHFGEVLRLAQSVEAMPTGQDRPVPPSPQ